MDDQKGPLEQEIDELFTRKLHGHPSILALTTGEVQGDDPDIVGKALEALSLLAMTEREALLRIARRVDRLGAE